jgi:hypothetical protein
MLGDKIQKLIGLFVLFSFLLNFPMLQIFSTAQLINGIPILYLYVFGVWGLLIFLIYRIVK